MTRKCENMMCVFDSDDQLERKNSIKSSDGSAEAQKWTLELPPSVGCRKCEISIGFPSLGEATCPESVKMWCVFDSGDQLERTNSIKSP